MLHFKITFIEKLKILVLIWLKKFNIVKTVLVARRIPLNDYAKEQLEKSDVQSIAGVRYKLAVDPSGQFRYWLLEKDPTIVYRVNKEHRLANNVPDLPLDLSVVLMKEGRGPDKFVH